MHTNPAPVADVGSSVRARPRAAWADHLKVALVAGVVVAHATMAWTHVGDWVFQEPRVREPLLSVLTLTTAVVGLFGMPLFFLVAGYFAPTSLSRKRARRFIADRALRLLVPMLAFMVVLSPPIEFVDPQNAGWTGGFWDFVPRVLWPPVPGPTWFLAVLFVFSVGYAVLRAVRPPHPERPEGSERSARTPSVRVRWLVLYALAVAAAAFPVMVVAPIGEEVWHLSIAQAPAWLAGFTLGVLARERAWLPLAPGPARAIRWVAWSAALSCVLTFVAASLSGADVEVLLGGGTWPSAVVAVVQGLLVVFASLWVVDLFQRRFDRGTARTAALSRAAYGAFLVHQGVLVALVLGSRLVGWPPEASYLVVAVLGVSGSFGIGLLLAHTPGVRRIV